MSLLDIFSQNKWHQVTTIAKDVCNDLNKITFDQADYTATATAYLQVLTERHKAPSLAKDNWYYKFNKEKLVEESCHDPRILIYMIYCIENTKFRNMLKIGLSEKRTMSLLKAIDTAVTEHYQKLKAHPSDTPANPNDKDLDETLKFFDQLEAHTRNDTYFNQIRFWTMSSINDFK